jgi:hypothetical protein
MCTVTLIARNNGYLLGMNRDEQRSRASGLPPAVSQHHGVKVLYPSEPQGGTWIAVNEAGTCFALINWYSIGRRVESNATSRGQVVLQAINAASLADAGYRLARLPLARTNPFRLIGVSRIEKRVREWRWDLESLSPQDHPWRVRQWVSSGHDELGAKKSRGRAFAAALQQSSAGSVAWLRSMHRSHRPDGGPYSTCMHREDAVTVSYSEVSVTSKSVLFRYANGAPCHSALSVATRL